MALSLAGLITTVGFALLIHTTYQVIKYREVLKLAQQEFEGLPFQLILELAIGATVALLGGFMLSGPVRSIVMKSARSMDVGSLRTDFISFNHRGRAMPLDLKPLK